MAAIPYYKQDLLPKENILQTGNRRTRESKLPLQSYDSDNEEDACELSFDFIVKNKPSPGKVREFLQACVDQMNDDTDEDTDFE
jgi:hypothetical protein